MSTYFCFIERDIMGVPHMEALDAESHQQARDQAEAVLRTHASGIAAHIMLDEVRIATIRRLGPNAD